MAGSPLSTSGRERYLESLWIERILQRETAGGLIIVGAAFLAVILANSPLGDSYFGLRDTYVSLGFGLRLEDQRWPLDRGWFVGGVLLPRRPRAQTRICLR